MQTVLFTALYLSVSFIESYVAYRRCKLEKIKYALGVSVVLFLVILFTIGILGKTQLAEYMQTIFFPSPESTVSIFSFYITIYVTALYIIFTLITEDLLKNLSIFIPGSNK